MASISISLANLFEQAFGYSPDNFHPDFSKYSVNPVDTQTLKEVTGAKQPYGSASMQAVGGSPLYATDMLGRSYFMPVSIGLTEQSMVPLPYPVVHCEWEKSIVDTPLTERSGTVKELVSIKNYRISIQGLIIAKDKQWPEIEIKQLHQLFLIKDALILKCALTDIFLITKDRSASDKVVIKSGHVLPQKGNIGVVPYEMELESDEIVSLEKIN